MHEDDHVELDSRSNEQKKENPSVIITSTASATATTLLPSLKDESNIISKSSETATATISEEQQEQQQQQQHYNSITADESTTTITTATTTNGSTTNSHYPILQDQDEDELAPIKDDNKSTEIDNDEEMAMSESGNNTAATTTKIDNSTTTSAIDEEMTSVVTAATSDTTTNKEQQLKHGHDEAGVDDVVDSEHSNDAMDIVVEKDEVIHEEEKKDNHHSTTTTTTSSAMEIDTNDKKHDVTEEETKIPKETMNVSNEASANTTNDNSNSNKLTNGEITSTTTVTSSMKSSQDQQTSNGSSSVKESTTATTTTTTSTSAPADTNTDTTTASTAVVVPPVMKGTLCIDTVNDHQRRYLIRGMWNYENSTTFPPQRFELIRNIPPPSTDDNSTTIDDDNTLPVDGEFHGSFSLAYFHTTSKGKQKERSKIIPETGVMIKFIKDPTNTDTYKVEGTGTNQFGIFHIYGTATNNPKISETDLPTMSIVFRKRYEPGLPVATTSSTTDNNNESTISSSSTYAVDNTTSSTTINVPGPLPDPAISYPSGVVALRGKLFKEESNDLGTTEVVHRINGTWASGLDYIVADPQNIRGLCNRFEYEHKSAVPTQQFPVSGKYSGWFDLSNEDGTRTRINERDVLLKFRTNNKGYQNVEGKGSNVFGKYTITGTLTNDNIITIFRHFQPRKLKKSNSGVVNAAADGTTAQLTSSTASSSLAVEPNTSLSSNAIALGSTSNHISNNSARRVEELKLSFDDVKIPPNQDGTHSEPFDAIVPPIAGTYSAVSRGVLRVNEDGSHSCQGKWAATREHFTNGQTSGFTFRLEPHFVSEEAMKVTSGDKFPLDSIRYKGSFQLKKQGSRYQTIVDQQVVMKFTRNKNGAYNVHGTGINTIGEFNLIGTLVTSGKTGGQVELYRMYPPEKLAVQPAIAPPSQIAKSDGTVGSGASPTKLPANSVSASSTLPAPSSMGALPSAVRAPQQQLQRRESSRMSKLPPHLEEDDYDAQLSRTMDKCLQILNFMRERDVELGAFFSEPVDPIALGIPTYIHIIKEPMDLRTIERKMKADMIETPEEFARLVRLVFENAMTFNVDPGHSVHQAARNLLVIFNQKYRDIERSVQNIRRTHGIDVDDNGKPKGKDDKKRKGKEERKSMKRVRLDEAQAMSAANATAMSSIISAMPTTDIGTVTRQEFSLLLKLVNQLHNQIVQTHLAIAELCPGDGEEGTDGTRTDASSKGIGAGAAGSEKKKGIKRKAEVAEEEYLPPVESSLPLTEKEQELLMETINGMPQEHLEEVVEIIREAAPVDENDDVIDLGIDQLDDATQRKLFRHIQLYLKKIKPKAKKKMKSNPPAPSKKVAEKVAPPPKKAPVAPKPKPQLSSDSFFRFGQKNGSDSDDDSDDDDNNNGAVARGAGGKQISSSSNGGKYFSGSDGNDFQLGAGLDLAEDDNDEDNMDIVANWGDMSKTNGSKKDDDDEEEGEDEDDDWGRVAREQAAAAAARDADRRAREEKKKAEVALASRNRLAEAEHRREELKAQRAEDEAKETSIREQQEREAEEAREKAKKAARAKLSSVQQTVDMDAQRDLMRQYDFDKDLGGASPSSDFGF